MEFLPNSVICLVLLALGASAAARPPGADLKKEVADSERAFAATLKARDFAGFGKFVAGEAGKAVFGGAAGPLRGARGDHGSVGKSITRGRRHRCLGSRSRSRCWHRGRWPAAAGRCMSCPAN